MKKVKCPQCGKKCEYNPKSKFRPFCSERCQIIDLGSWASDGYVIKDTRTDVSERELDEDDEFLH